MRFLLDMGIDVRIARWLRDHGHDAVHLREQGLQRLPDAEIFQKAVTESRIILTFDLDFGEIAALSRGRAPTIVLFLACVTRLERVRERLARCLEELGAELAPGTIVVIEDARMRMRRLPIE